MLTHTLQCDWGGYVNDAGQNNPLVCLMTPSLVIKADLVTAPSNTTLPAATALPSASTSFAPPFQQTCSL